MSQRHWIKLSDRRLIFLISTLCCHFQIILLTQQGRTQSWETPALWWCGWHWDWICKPHLGLPFPREGNAQILIVPGTLTRNLQMFDFKIVSGLLWSISYFTQANSQDHLHSFQLLDKLHHWDLPYFQFILKTFLQQSIPITDSTDLYCNPSPTLKEPISIVASLLPLSWNYISDMSAPACWLQQ